MACKIIDPVAREGTKGGTQQHKETKGQVRALSPTPRSPHTSLAQETESIRAELEVNDPIFDPSLDLACLARGGRVG